jgi:hypothetical protein
VTRELTGHVHVCLGDAAPTSYTYVLGEALTCELLLKFSDTGVPVTTPRSIFSDLATDSLSLKVMDQPWIAISLFDDTLRVAKIFTVQRQMMCQ